MGEFRVEFLPAAARDLEKVASELRPLLLREIKANLEKAPFPRGKILKKLHGFRIPTYELKIIHGGLSYRVVYRIEGHKVLILMIPPRKELKRRLKKLS